MCTKCEQIRSMIQSRAPLKVDCGPVSIVASALCTFGQGHQVPVNECENDSLLSLSRSCYMDVVVLGLRYLPVAKRFRFEKAKL